MKVLRLVRAIAVVIVPSLVLEFLAVASTVSTVRALLSRARRDRNPRPLRPLTLAGTVAPWLYLTLVRPWHLRWGATDEEVTKPLPGDEMTPEPSAQSTHAITIEAPPEVVWPWLMQLGQGRGGWYSYDWLENLAGLEIHSRERVVPKLRLEVGDPVRWGPEEFAPVAWRVRAIEPGRALLLDGWAFVVEPLDGNRRSRLIARTRISGKVAALGWGLLIELPHFLMERKLLKGIKERAERNLNARNGTMDGKVVLVTGGTGGIGKDIAEGLASMGANVVVAGHDRSKGEAAVAEIKAKSGHEAVELMVADLSSQAEIHRLVREFEANHHRLDVLVNNAGALYAKRFETAEGIEGTLAVIHLAPVLLTNLLLPMLQKSAPSRIVNVSSWSHRRAKLDLDDLQMREHYSPSAAYSRAKLINLLWTYELARRLEGTGVTVNLADPGGASTDTTRSEAMPWILRTINRLGQKVMTTEKAARVSIYLASSAEVEGVNGAYFDNNKKRIRSSKGSYEEAAGKRIWEISAELAKLDRSLPIYEGSKRGANRDEGAQVN
jgi:NAD(P)-dependent dehydrogenase (short-subunit alcohol dehydrogenase family)